MHINTHTDIAIAWSGQLLYDFVVFLLTLVGSLRIRKKGSGSRSIIDTLLRDGVSIDLALPLRLSPINCQVLCTLRALKVLFVK